MHRLISTLALLTTFVAPANAQIKPGKSAMRPDSMHATSASCPLDLKNIKLTRAQQVVVDSIRAEHRATMMKLMPEQMKQNMMSGRAGMTMPPGDTAAMERSMKKSVAATRAVLTSAQRVVFDSAVVKHEAEMTAAMARGGNPMACCMECMRPGGRTDHMMPKKPEA